MHRVALQYASFCLQQRESAVSIHIPPRSWSYLPLGQHYLLSVMVNFLGFGSLSPLFFILNNIADVWVLYTEKWETHYYEGRKGVAAVQRCKEGPFPHEGRGRTQRPGRLPQNVGWVLCAPSDPLRWAG